VTDYLSVGQADRTLAITVIAFGLQACLLFWFAIHKGRRVAPAVLWVFPAMLIDGRSTSWSTMTRRSGHPISCLRG